MIHAFEYTIKSIQMLVVVCLALILLPFVITFAALHALLDSSID